MEGEIQYPHGAPANHSHSPHLQHHFGSLEQQFDSGKLGMWIFLGTEILLFGGLFCAYSVYRSNHPEVFIYAHQFLDKTWGAVNTCVLLISSFTMAWAVRCSQRGKQTGLVVLLAATLLCGFAFLGIKYVEYKAKWEHGLLWGKRYSPAHHEDVHPVSFPEASPPGDLPVGPATTGAGTSGPAPGGAPPAGVPPSHASPGGAATVAAVAAETGSPSPTVIMTTPAGVVVEGSMILPAALSPEGTVSEDGQHDFHTREPHNVQVFFSVYFTMTGLHGLHVIVGMICIGWILRRSIRKEFGPAYFTPVDLVGLYWHLVDLIWIYLFPLLYLIH